MAVLERAATAADVPYETAAGWDTEQLQSELCPCAACVDGCDYPQVRLLDPSSGARAVHKQGSREVQQFDRDKWTVASARLVKDMESAIRAELQRATLEGGDADGTVLSVKEVLLLYGLSQAHLVGTAGNMKPKRAGAALTVSGKYRLPTFLRSDVGREPQEIVAGYHPGEEDEREFELEDYWHP